jgi:hypothetical protein
MRTNRSNNFRKLNLHSKGEAQKPFKLPSFLTLGEFPKFSGNITTLLDHGQKKIEEYVKYSDWIDKKLEKNEVPDIFNYKPKPHEGNYSKNSQENHSVLIWLFKFVFSMDDFWLKRAIFFEFKLNILRFIDRLTCLKKLSNNEDNPIQGKFLIKTNEKKFGGAREKVFNLVSYLILHEYYFIKKFGQPSKLLKDLSDLEWIRIIEEFLVNGSVPVMNLYFTASQDSKNQTLLDHFNQITNTNLSKINLGKSEKHFI